MKFEQLMSIDISENSENCMYIFDLTMSDKNVSNEKQKPNVASVLNNLSL